MANFDAKIAKMEKMLYEEEQCVSINSLDELKRRHEVQDFIRETLIFMQDDIQFLKKRVKQLPYLPDTNVFRQAQNLLLMDNLVFLEVNETDLRGSLGSFNIVVMDRDRNMLLNTLVGHSSWLEAMDVPSEISQNQEELTWQESASVFPEKSQDQDQLMSTVAQIWSTLQMTIAGKHVLTYDLTFLETFLASYIRFAHLPPLGLVGTSLQDLCHLYFRPTGSLELDRICQKIDLPLPKYATVIDRVNAELSLLQAMAEGVVEKRKIPSPHKSIIKVEFFGM